MSVYLAQHAQQGQCLCIGSGAYRAEWLKLPPLPNVLQPRMIYACNLIWLMWLTLGSSTATPPPTHTHTKL